jgi:2',3'-cyclic-nucleotide 2'-phosphodiesterase (5'-nucleotidase family)
MSEIMRNALHPIAVALAAAVACEMPPDTRPDVGVATADLTVLWTGAIEGELYPCSCPHTPYGGLARLASVIETELAADPSALLIDLGDFAGDPIEGAVVDEMIARRERAWITLETLGMMGYRALVPGERDLTLGVDRLQDAAREAGIDLLSTNLWRGEPAEPLGLTEMTIDTDVGPVALLSITAPPDPDQVAAAEQGHGRPLDVLEPVPALRLALRSVTPRAALVLLLAHGPTTWARDLLAQVEGVDLCIVAHDDDDPAIPIEVGDSVLVTTGRRGHALGRLRLRVRSDGGAGIGGAAVAVVEDAGEDPEVAAVVETIGRRQEDAQRALDEANEGASHPSGYEYVGFSRCGPCHGDQASAWYASPHIDAFHALQQIGWHVEPECFECHTTGFGFAGGFVDRQLTPTLAGVTCEACHGPGEECEGRDRAPVEDTCRGCHTADTAPAFDFESSLAQVRHRGF